MHFGTLRVRDGEEEEPLASVVFPPSTIAKQCTKCHAATQAFHFSLWLPSMLSGLENGCIHAQAPRITEPKHSQQIDRVRVDDALAKEHCMYGRDRRLRCEDEKTSLRIGAMCGLLLFFLWSWQRRRRSEIGCYSARRGAAFHCFAWEMFEHWRKTTGEYEFGSFSSRSGPDWSP